MRDIFNASATNNPRSAIHSTSLREAVAEVIWAEVLKQMLPFGSVPAYAIVRQGEAAHHLVLRQASLCHAAYQGAALSEIYAEFASIFGDDIRHLRGNARISQGLIHVLRRYAVQFSAGVARCLPYELLAPAHLALDGRVNVAGATQLLSGRTTDRYADPARSKFRTLVYSLRDFHRQVECHWGKDGLISRAALLEAFRRSYLRGRATHLLKLTGMPAAFWIKQESSGRTRFFRQVRRLDAAARHAVMTEAALTADAHLDQHLHGLINDDASRQSFVESYILYRNRFIAVLPMERQPYGRLYLALQAHRLNADWVSAVTEWSRFDGEPEQVSAHIGNALDHLRYLVPDLHPDLPAPTALSQIDELMYLDRPLDKFVAECMRRAKAGSSAIARALSLAAACRLGWPQVAC
ncbi:hypothetical protein [Pseudoduganella violaceinigra]|uniref:hypothetical protein n=1 Tax=Pseudoduganella violaceinigra TaxID=246602 RepID=UPI000557A26F|nr:hypothetical protein [Pseudoduganella violaceinigra]